MKLSAPKALLALLTLLCSFTAIAQQTGSFNTAVLFNGESRTLSYYVPTDYDSMQSYRLLVGLHGAGDNSTNARDVFATFLPGQMPNTIFVFPDGGDDLSRDFYTPAGDEEFIPFAIDHADSLYNIDRTDIILEGFSLGGRSALKYGLEHYAMFKGLFLHTPAVQGVKEALNKSFTTFMYENVPNIPIYITHGDQDIFYTGPTDSMYRQLILNDGRAIMRRFAGGHVIPISATPAALDFIYNPDSLDYDAEVVSINTPRRTCDASVSVPVLVRNTGSQAITSITLDYGINSGSQSHTWNGNLEAYEHAIINLPAVTAAGASNNFIVEINSLNSGMADEVSANSSAGRSFDLVSQGVSLPYVQGFNDTTAFPPQNWVLQPSGDLILPWTPDVDIKRDGTAGIMSLNTIFYFDNSSRKEEILSPVMDLSSESNPELSFDLMFNYIRYTPPVFTATVEFSDTLEVLISTDCGQTFTSLYKKAGADLATFDDPILNPLDIDSVLIEPTASDWRHERISLSNYASSKEAVIKFSYISGLGGCIGIDNFRVGKRDVGIAAIERPAGEVLIYPNPANELLNISSRDASVQLVNIYDLSGKRVMSRSDHASTGEVFTMNVSSLEPGVYMVEVVTNGDVNRSKLVIGR